MVRRVWDGEFANLWFGFRSPIGRRVRRPEAPSNKPGTAEAGKPTGIVERNRRARREAWALKAGGKH